VHTRIQGKEGRQAEERSTLKKVKRRSRRPEKEGGDSHCCCRSGWGRILGSITQRNSSEKRENARGWTSRFAVSAGTFQ